MEEDVEAVGCEGLECLCRLTSGSERAKCTGLVETEKRSKCDGRCNGQRTGKRVVIGRNVVSFGMFLKGGTLYRSRCGEAELAPGNRFSETTTRRCIEIRTVIVKRMSRVTLKS